MMEQWQSEAIQELLGIETKEIESGQRVYLSSVTYGSNRYHLIEKRFDGIQVEQLESGEKWRKRLNFSADEVPGLLKTLLSWHLEEIRQRQEQEEVSVVLSADRDGTRRKPQWLQPSHSRF